MRVNCLESLRDEKGNEMRYPDRHDATGAKIAEGEPITLQSEAFAALIEPSKDDEKLNKAQRLDLYQLACRVAGPQPIELSEDNKNVIGNRVAARRAGNWLIGQVNELLNKSAGDSEAAVSATAPA